MLDRTHSSSFASLLRQVAKILPAAALCLTGVACGDLNDLGRLGDEAEESANDDDDAEDSQAPIELDLGGGTPPPFPDAVDDGESPEEEPPPAEDPPPAPPPAPPPETPDPGPNPFDGTGEECVMLNDDKIVRIDLDTGATEDIVSLNGTPMMSSVSSLARLGDAIYFCGRTLQKASMVTGDVTEFSIECDGVASWGDRLVVMEMFADYDDPFGRMKIYDAAAIADGFVAPTGGLPLDPWASRIAIHGDVGLFAWHATDTIDRYDLNTFEQLESITMENYDTWVNGMAIRANGELAVNAAWPEDRIAILNAEDGAAVRDLGVSDRLSGLVCVVHD